MAGKPRMLVVDDDEKTGRALCRILTRHGWSVAKAASTDDALEALSNLPDCIILDLSRATGEAERLLKAVRARKVQPRIILTARYAAPARIRAIRARFAPDAILLKPVVLDAFLAAGDGTGSRAPNN